MMGVVWRSEVKRSNLKEKQIIGEKRENCVLYRMQ
jgi:hypothetical protein